MSNSAKSVWNLSDEALILANAAVSKHKLKHGMFSGIPIICRGEHCPYKAVCNIPDQHVKAGDRCPVEIGAIIARFDHWCNHFTIDTSSDIINDEDLVDASLIRDMVDIEIQMLRADNRMAINADFISQTISQIDARGRVYYEDKISAESEFKLQLLDKRYKILQLLNSTRKDKAKDLKLELTPSEKAISIFKKVSDKLDTDLDLSGVE